MVEIIKHKDVIIDAAWNAVAECVFVNSKGVLCVSSKFLRVNEDVVRRFTEVLQHFGVGLSVVCTPVGDMSDCVAVLIKDGVWCYE